MKTSKQSWWTLRLRSGISTRRYPRPLSLGGSSLPSGSLTCPKLDTQ